MQGWRAKPVHDRALTRRLLTPVGSILPISSGTLPEWAPQWDFLDGGGMLQESSFNPAVSCWSPGSPSDGSRHEPNDVVLLVLLFPALLLSVPALGIGSAVMSR